MWIEKEISVDTLRNLWNTNQYDIEIDSPDGWQAITNWFDKGKLPTVTIKTASGLTTTCAVNHLLQQTINQKQYWTTAENINEGAEIVTVNGFNDRVTFTEYGEEMECFDFTVDHPNHRYWGDGFSSHNSGKSLISSYVIKEALAQGITVVAFDTENGLTKEWLENTGVDVDKYDEEFGGNGQFTRIQVSLIDNVAKTINEVTKMYVETYKSVDRDERPGLLFVIDSLGMLITRTDEDQFSKGDLKGDMGRKPKALNALIRNCVVEFSEFEIGLLATNHTYQSQDMFDPDDKISGGCLTAGHKVLLADGSLKCIEDMEINDHVMTLEGIKPVTNIWHFNKPTITFELEDGSTIECTEEHKFMVKCEEGFVWKQAKDLDENDRIINA